MNGVPVNGAYINLHLLPIFKKKVAYNLKNFPWSLNKKKYSYKKGDCPVAERMNEKNYIGLNMWKYDSTENDIKFIIKKFNKVWSKLKMKTNGN